MVLQTKPMTVEEFDAFVLLPENRDNLFEYIGGGIVEVVSSDRSSELGMLFGAFITVFVRANGLGRVTGADGGYIVAGERYIPDVAFISKARQPHALGVAYNPLPPDLVVEVLSPSNTDKEIRIKIVNYLRAGTVVWLVNPELKRIEVYVPGEAPCVLGVNDTLDGGAVLPGFTLPVKTIFPE